jgi:hypothetical protein
MADYDDPNESVDFNEDEVNTTVNVTVNDNDVRNEAEIEAKFKAAIFSFRYELNKVFSRVTRLKISDPRQFSRNSENALQIISSMLIKLEIMKKGEKILTHHSAVFAQKRMTDHMASLKKLFSVLKILGVLEYRGEYTVTEMQILSYYLTNLESVTIVEKSNLSFDSTESKINKKIKQENWKVLY